MRTDTLRPHAEHDARSRSSRALLGPLPHRRPPMDRARSAAWARSHSARSMIVARPDKAPLEHRVPEVTSRALPNGRGFLRLVGPGKGPSPEGPTTPLAPMPVAPLAAVAPEEPTKQLDLFAWRPREPKKGQLDLFGGDDDQR